jgi:uncharacterized protein (TIGR02453 family)
MLTRKTFAFLKDLDANNNRAWFEANKARYQEEAQEPFREFIRAMEPRFAKMSEHILCSDKKVGGAMMRVNRDVRFSKDKSPYSPRLAARFMHADGDKGGTPGFMIHIGPSGCTLGTGVWQPDTPSVAKIRQSIVDNSKAWKSASTAKAFRDAFGDLAGDSLKRPPRGFDAEHPLVEDLKRKDFVGFRELKMTPVTTADFPATAAKAYAASNKFMAFLCHALDLPY